MQNLMAHILKIFSVQSRRQPSLKLPRSPGQPRIKLALLLGAALLAAVPAPSTLVTVTLYAAPLESLPPRALGAGGAYMAIADDSSAFSTNPAGISRTAEYRRIYVSSRFYRLDSSAQAKGSQWGLQSSVIDGITEDPIHWGFNFDTTRTAPTKRQKYELATSIDFKNLILIGLTHRFSQYNRTPTNSASWVFTMDAGVLAFITDYLALAATTKNFVRSKKDKNLSPFTYGAGLSLNFKPLRISAEAEREHSLPQTWIRSGLEYTLTPYVISRAGYFQDRTRDQYGFTLGMSVLPDHRFNLDLAYLQQLKSDYKNFSFGIVIQI